MKKNKRKLGFLVLTFCVLSLYIVTLLTKNLPEEQIRAKVVKLIKKEGGSCSGEQVKAESGQTYILTAAHCRALEENGSIEVVTEDGRHLMRKIIEEDDKSDLMLLEGIPNLDGLDIANYSYFGQHVRTFTHGAGLDTYMTEGRLVQDIQLQIPMFVVETAEDEAACNKAPKYEIIMVDTFLGGVRGCFLSVTETVTTATVVPGSSGGMVVNDNGSLVGVVSAGDGQFGSLVTLEDIKKFLSNY